MFELKTVTETELTAFVGRTQKSGPDDVPAVSFRLRLAGVPNEMLDMFSPTLRHGVYMAVPGQDDLEGIEPATPLLRSKDVMHLAPDFRYEGWTVSVARGLSDDALQMGSAKVDDFKFDFHEGGRMDFDFRVSTADIDEEGAGMLWGRQKRKVFVRIEAPEMPAPVIDGTIGHPGAAAAPDARDPDAPDLFNGDGPGPFDEGGQPDDGEGSAPDVTAGGGDPEGEAEQRELEAGMATAITKAGVKAKRGGRGARA
jgi:hypothetical protein